MHVVNSHLERRINIIVTKLWWAICFEIRTRKPFIGRASKAVRMRVSNRQICYTYGIGPEFQYNISLSTVVLSIQVNEKSFDLKEGIIRI